jgi:hypothetical protein
VIAPADKSGADYRHRLVKKIIRQAFKDVTIGDERHFDDASRYINSPLLAEHIRKVGYPAELRDTLRELVLFSRSERKHLYIPMMRLLGQLPERK